MKRPIKAGFIIAMALFFSCGTESGKLVVSRTTCEYATHPMGVDKPQPRFGWQLESDERDQHQIAYHLVVVRSPKGLNPDHADMWNSKIVFSDRSIHVPYKGLSLESGQRYTWSVRVCSQDSVWSDWSEPSQFVTGILNPQEWRAEWIGRQDQTPQNDKGYYDAPDLNAHAESLLPDSSSLLLRKNISLSKPIKSAVAFASGLGFYEFYINGIRVGNKVLNPAKTNYGQRVLYDTYDVTALLHTGENGLGFHVGNGWYNPLKKWWSWRMQWFGSKRAMLQMHITYEDGSTDTVITDASWKASKGPVQSACIYDGEIYDARLEQSGWSRPQFDDSEWSHAMAVQPPGGQLTAQVMPAIKLVEEIEPKSITRMDSSVVVDMGQNFSGWLRVRIDDSEPGARIVLKYAENLDAKTGHIDPHSNNLALARDIYVCRGETPEIYEPRFTWHGFRYVEITGLEDLDADAVVGCVVHSDCTPAGDFDLAHDKLEHVHDCVLWSQRSNLLGVPLDCPQRDERLGWLGDAHVTAKEAMYNFDMALFYEKWLEDIRMGQDPETGALPHISPRPFLDAGGDPPWSAGYALMCWDFYKHYHDREFLAHHYPAMKAYVRYLSSQATDYVLPPSRYGDWASANETGWWSRGMHTAVSTGYYLYCSQILTLAAKALGIEHEAEVYEDLARQIRKAYHVNFFHFENGSAFYEMNSQFANLFPLYLGVPPAELDGQVWKSLLNNILHVHNGHLSTGILGTQYLMELLSERNRIDIAWLIATRPDYPGWIDMTLNRTTLSEHWNGHGSNNHVMFGSIDSWLYQYIAGIRSDALAPGFKRFTIRPMIPPQLGWVKASTRTLYGKVASQWRVDGDRYELHVTVPVNTRALVFVLTSDRAFITENGNEIDSDSAVRFIGMQRDHAVFEVGSGHYIFRSRITPDLIPRPWVENVSISPDKNVIFNQGKAEIRLSCPTPGADIRYTLDGSMPHERSALYSDPVPLENSCTLHARAFKEGLHDGFPSSQSFSVLDPQVNGLTYRYFRGRWDRVPDFETLEPERTGKIYDLNLGAVEPDKFDFAIEFSGRIAIPESGNYTFFLASNDGSWMQIDDRLLIDNDGGHPLRERSGDVYLHKGEHGFRVGYFQTGGSYALNVAIKGPGLPRQAIPLEWFRSE